MPRAKPRKTCPEGKIRNRISGVCVNPKGKIGKRLIEEDWKIIFPVITQYASSVTNPDQLTVRNAITNLSETMDEDYVREAIILKNRVKDILLKRHMELSQIPEEGTSGLDCSDICKGTSLELINPITKQKIVRGRAKFKELYRICNCDDGRKNGDSNPSVKKRGRPKKEIRYEDPQNIVDLIRIYQSRGIMEFINIVIRYNNGQFLPDLVRIYRRAKKAAQESQLQNLVLKFGQKNNGRHIKVSATGNIARTLEELSIDEDIDDDEEVSDEGVGLVQNVCRAKVLRDIPSETFTPRSHQRLVGEIMKRDNTRLLLEHGLGSGKTCSSTIVISDYIKRHPDRYVYFFSPGGLRANFISEYCTKCPVDRRQIPDDKEYERIRFFSLDDGALRKKLPKSFKDSLVVVDEAQSLINSVRNDADEEEDSERNLPILFDMIVEESDLSLLLLSGTPMPNNLGQHYNCLKLLKPEEIGKYSYAEFESMFEGGYNRNTKSYTEYKPKDEFKNIIASLYSNCISYYVNPPSDVASVKTKVCNQSIAPDSKLASEIINIMRTEDIIRMKSLKKLVRDYIKKYNLPIKEARKKAIRDKTRAKRREVSRRLSNVMHPEENNQADTEKIPQERLDDETLKYVGGDLEKLFRDHAPKLGRLVRNLKDIGECPGKQAIYCPFKVSGGVKLLSKIMSMMGISHITYSGDVDMTTRQKILSEYNAPSNDYGEKIKVFMYTDAAAEGISLKSIRGIHLVNEDIDASHTNQVIGRAIRFESHIRLLPEERTVTIYRYRLVIGDGDNLVKGADLDVYEEGLQKIKLLDYIHDMIKTEWNTTK